MRDFVLNATAAALCLTAMAVCCRRAPLCSKEGRFWMQAVFDQTAAQEFPPSS